MNPFLSLIGLLPEVAEAIAKAVKHMKRGEVEEAQLEARRAAELQAFRAEQKAKRPPL